MCHNGSNGMYAELSRKCKSSILPQKKNMVVGIDKQELVDDTARTIYSGMAGFLGENRIGKGCRVLIEGEQVALAKFLVDNFEAIEVTVVTNLVSLRDIAPTYLEVL